MADASHLEKMGRELKCPICLSLLSSAASLTCNHVFCNSCIQKSIRSDSHCPVCKVPVGRREVRSAPHMDNLVNIYKNMEIASGINIFMTQNAALIGNPDEGNCGEDVSKTSNSDLGRARNKAQLLHKASQSKLKSSGRKPAKPSLRTNKRVQVPKSPLPETPMQLPNSKCDGDGAMNNLLNSKAPNPCSTLKESRNQLLRPLFWLREDEADKSSQQEDGGYKSSQPTDDGQLCFTPVETPNFSDIKDSDDDIPDEMIHKAKARSKSNVAEFFDSDMFEWTQRACSPELCSTPVKMQDSSCNYDERLDKISGMLEGGVASTCNSSEKIHARGSSTVHAVETKISERPTGSKRSRKGRTRSQSKRAKGSAGNEVDGFVPDAECGPAVHESASNNNGMSAMASEENLTVQAKLLNQVGDKMASKLPASSRIEQGHLESTALVNSRNSNIINPCQKKRQAKSKEEKPVQTKPKKQSPSFDKLDQSKEVTLSQQPQFETGMSKIPKLMAEASAGKGSTVRVDNLQKSPTSCKPVKCVQESKRRGEVEAVNDIMDKQGVLELKCQGKVEAVKDIMDKQGDARISIHAEAVDPTGSDHPLEAANESECRPSVITCVFCHSAEETEATGEMIHYFQGKPVSNDYDGGSHVIHSHKSCTEWAPNVYFEGDIAINIEAELARSRRIKCGLCGVKGAALGCYDKGCRRSFHVPCAKRLKQSRWDTDNYVMLCPLHTSSKLPKEQSRAHLKRKENVKRRSENPIKHDTNTNLWNPHGCSNKLHLCCSALVTEEMEVVTEFQRLSGALVSKNWNPTVTHIIASVDENGAFKRTLKVLTGILEGKWILSIEWIKACLKARTAVDETAYEMNVDTHGIKGGPCLGRLRLENKQPKLFAGIRFYLTGDFKASYKGYLNDLISSAGGTILHRKPLAEDKGKQSTDCSLSTIIIYSLELPDKYDISKKDVILNGRRAEAQALANSSGSKIASNLWVMNSISGYKLHPLQGSML